MSQEINNYPTFWTWYTDKYKEQAQRFLSRCDELNIPAIAEHLPVEKYAESLEYVRNSLSHKRFVFKAGLLFLRDRFLVLQKPLFYLHSDDKILIKPEKSIFDKKKIGYCVGKRKDGKHITLSHGIFLDYCQLSKDFLDLLTFKAKIIRGEIPTEHALIRLTLMDFSGKLFDDKLIPNGSKINFKNKFTFRNKVKPLQGEKKKYILSDSTDTYIKWN